MAGTPMTPAALQIFNVAAWANLRF
jgi:hypothetical protein